MWMPGDDVYILHVQAVVGLICIRHIFFRRLFGLIKMSHCAEASLYLYNQGIFFSKGDFIQCFEDLFQLWIRALFIQPQRLCRCRETWRFRAQNNSWFVVKDMNSQECFRRKYAFKWVFLLPKWERGANEGATGELKQVGVTRSISQCFASLKISSFFSFAVEMQSRLYLLFY